jgi:hypothetical protein
MLTLLSRTLHKTTVSLFKIFLSQYLHIRLYATHFTGSRGVLRADPVFEQLGQGAQTEPTIDILAQMH